MEFDWNAIELQERFVLLDTESADWAELASEGSAFEMNPDKRTPQKEWTRLVQYNYLGQKVVILDLATPEGVAGLQDLRHLVDSGVEFVIHNCLYDLPRLAKLGIYPKHIFDTMTASQMQYTGCPEIRHNLADVMLREVGVDPYAAIAMPRILEQANVFKKNLEDLARWKQAKADYLRANPDDEWAEAVFFKNNPAPCPAPPVSEETLPKWIATQANMAKKRLQNSDWGKLTLTEEQLAYAAADVGPEYLEVYRNLKKHLVERGLERAFEFEMEFLPAIAEMHIHGMKYNLAVWKTMIQEKTKVYEDLEKSLTLRLDSWCQQAFPDRYMITLGRKKPHPAVPAKWTKGKPEVISKKTGKVLHEAVPPQLISPEIPAAALGELKKIQPTPTLSPVGAIHPDLLALENGDYRVGGPLRKELGLTPGDTVAITQPVLLREIFNWLLGSSGDGFDKKEVEELLHLAEVQNQSEAKQFLTEYQEAMLLHKLISTYGESFWQFCDPGGYIHASFSTTEADTHRVQAREPNVVNMPRTMQKELWCNENGYKLIKGDYSAQEAKLVFYVGKQFDIYQKLLAGMDIHSMSASIVSGKPYETLVDQVSGKKDKVKAEFDELRSNSKPVSFSPMYGAQAGKIAQLLNCSWKEGNAFITNYWKIYPMVKVMQDRQVSKALNLGYVTDLTFGRKRYFSPTTDDKLRMAAGEDRNEVLYKFRNPAMNFAGQSTGSSILRVAVLKLWNWSKRHPETETVIRLTIHDAIMTSCKSEYAPMVAAAQKRLMEQAATEVVPGIFIGVDIDILDHPAPQFFEEEYGKTA